MKYFGWLYLIWSLIVIVGGAFFLDQFFPAEGGVVPGELVKTVSIMMPFIFVVWFAVLYAGHWVLRKIEDKIRN